MVCQGKKLVLVLASFLFTTMASIETISMAYIADKFIIVSSLNALALIINNSTLLLKHILYTHHLICLKKIKSKCKSY